MGNRWCGICHAPVTQCNILYVGYTNNMYFVTVRHEVSTPGSILVPKEVLFNCGFMKPGGIAGYLAKKIMMKNAISQYR